MHVHMSTRATIDVHLFFSEARHLGRAQGKSFLTLKLIWTNKTLLPDETSKGLKYTTRITLKNGLFPTILGQGVSWVIQKPFQTKSATSIVARAYHTVVLELQKKG